MNDTKAWDKTYTRLGKIYGEKESLCAQEADLLMEEEQKLMREKKFRRILDIGCGYGRDAEYLSKKGYLAYGVDVSKKAIQMAKNWVKDAEFRIASATSLPYPDEFFDAIVSNFAYNLLEKGERKKMLSETRRVLKKNGLLLFTVYSEEEKKTRQERQAHKEPIPRHYFSKKKLLKEFGVFRVLKIEDVRVKHPPHKKGEKTHYHHWFLIIAEPKTGILASLAKLARSLFSEKL